MWIEIKMQNAISGVMELCTKGLGGSVPQLKQKNINLACVRTCVVVAEERPRIALTQSFTKLFSGLSLSPRAVSTSFGCRVNTAICLQVRSTNWNYNSSNFTKRFLILYNENYNLISLTGCKLTRSNNRLRWFASIEKWQSNINRKGSSSFISLNGVRQASSRSQCNYSKRWYQRAMWRFSFRRGTFDKLNKN